MKLDNQFGSEAEIEYYPAMRSFQITLRHNEAGMDTYLALLVDANELKNAIRSLEDNDG